ncbi:ABC transporter substrate-binding protein [Paenibacillus pasadenensis]|uniref:ABC transporter substrate-binding protein n=1 Tax=Paenibacillus pasadenensis TaxID=217090 RepID=UPI00203E02E4|nr:ABC transporter substrate-binding protein [Paenibacillus pasadenensis]MCM3746154.1 ABC transporter substrate-binding protein [Paenibacillus pasadenensis]
MHPKKIRFSALLCFVLLLLTAVLSACSGSGNGNGNTNSSQPEASPAATAPPSEGASGATTYPLTIENYTMNGEEGAFAAKEQVFEKAPERVVVNTQPIAEMLIKLGLTDKMVGVAALYGELDPEVKDEFAKIPVLSKEYVSKEPVVGANPDLVMGRSDLFADADWGVGTVEGLNELGIRTFINSTSLKGATVESLYKDIEQIGQIFDVQDKAAAHIEKLKGQVETLKSEFVGKGKEQTFAFVSEDGGIKFYSGINDTFQNEALGWIGLKNGFSDIEGSNVSTEEVVSRNPDVLLMSYYTGAPDPQKTIDAIYADPALKDINAVKNKKVYVIDFNAYWGYGDQIFNAIEKLGKELNA